MPFDHPDLPPWSPPPGWAEQPSARDGVSVFAPVPEEATDPGLRTYTCPACGATTAWDAAEGALACQHCGHRRQAAATVVGRAADAHEFTLESLREDAKGWGTERLELHCDTCGADLAVRQGAIAHTCAFCASNAVGVREATERRLRPQFVVPFQQTPEQLAPATRAWLGKGWMHPGSLAGAASVGHFRGVYLPWWMFSADLRCAWQAEVGHAHTSSYRDARGRRRTRTTIRWRHESGHCALQIRDHLVAGTARVSDRLLRRVADFDVAGLAVYTPDVLAGFEAQAYDIGLVDAWDRGKSDLRERGRAACRAMIHSPHVRNFRMTADFDAETWRYALLPVFVAAYRYDGKVYQLVANGQTGTVDGQKPVAWWKVWLAIAAMFLPGLLLGLVGLPLVLLGGAGLAVLFVALVALVLAVGGAWSLHRRALDAEAL